LPFATPVPRSIKGQGRGQRQTSLWRKCEAAPKRRPRTSIRGQVGHDAHPEGRHSKDGHPQPQPASWQAFGQDKILSRIPEPRPETHMPSASDRRFRTPSQTRKLSVRKAGESGTAPRSNVRRGACAGARLIALAVPSRLRSGGARSAASAPYRGVLASAIVVCPAAMRAQLLVAESAIVRGDVEARPQA
jgi:hypothetical protein